MADGYANFAVGVVHIAPYPADTGNTLTLRSGEGETMPTVPFNAVTKPKNVQAKLSNSEIVRVTARDGDTLTFDRSAEGTEAKEIAAGWDFYAGFTAKTLADIYAAITTGSGDKHYSQEFTAATSVTVTHNLAKYPSVTIIDSAGQEWEGADVDYVSPNQLIVSWPAAFSGIIKLN